MSRPPAIELAISVAIVLIVVRIANTYLLATFFQPDEYFQSLEPAWQLAFGTDSGAWLTWEWREQLRSATHPLLFSTAYKAADRAAKWLALGPAASADLLVLAPKFVQVPIAAAIDFLTWRLAATTATDTREPWVALLFSLWSPWQWYTSTRTFSNTLETMLTVLALVYWPWQWTVQAQPEKAEAQQGSVIIATAAAAGACILRPTNLIIWAAVVGTSVYRYNTLSKISEVLGKAILAGSAVLAVSISVDMAYYGTFTLPQLNFLYVNIIQSVAAFYGRNRIDYYFTEGLPLLLTTALPFAVIGYWKAVRPGTDKPELKDYAQRQTLFILAIVVSATVLIFSCIGHKEARFIYPLLPILHVLAAKPAAQFFELFPVEKNYTKVGILCVLLTLNLYIMTYTGLIHQRGVIDVMHYLRHEAEGISTVSNISVGFLMPCHSTPWRSHFVHPQIDAWTLTCEPPLGVPLDMREYYEDEADLFYNYPGGWLDKNMVDHKTIMQGKPFVRPKAADEKRQWPDYLVYFEHLEPTMNAVLDNTKYVEAERFFNTHWHDDWRRRGDVIVQKLNKK